MLWTLLLVASVVLSVGVDRIKAVESKDGSGFGGNSPAGKEDEDLEETTFENSGDDAGRHVPRVTVSVNHHQPPSAVDNEDPVNEEEEEEDLSTGGKSGGAGIVFEDDSRPEDAENTIGEPMSVKENSLITHPGILAAIIVGGVLVLVCLIIFFILIICCLRKKDEGIYDLDRAMKEKLKYITYTKADNSEREFFA